MVRPLLEQHLHLELPDAEEAFDRLASELSMDADGKPFLGFSTSRDFTALPEVVPIDSLHYLTSGHVVMMSLLGGMGTFFGPFVGAAMLLLIEDEATNITQYWQLLVGVIFILFVLFFPRGVWGSILHWVRR